MLYNCPYRQQKTEGQESRGAREVKSVTSHESPKPHLTEQQEERFSGSESDSGKLS